MRTKIRPASCAAGALLALALLAAGTAQAAEEVTRDSYKAAVEPICLANTRANERIFAGVRGEVNRGELKRAGRQFAKAAAALRKTIGELGQVPQPAEDSSRLGRWLAKAGKLASSFAVVAKTLDAGKRGKAANLVAHLTVTAEAANGLVLDFEFHYCRLEPSKFT